MYPGVKYIFECRSFSFSFWYWYSHMSKRSKYFFHGWPCKSRPVLTFYLFWRIQSGDDAQSLRRGEMLLLVYGPVCARAKRERKKTIPRRPRVDPAVIVVIVADSILTGWLCNVTGMSQRKLNSIWSRSFEGYDITLLPPSLSFLINFTGEESRSWLLFWRQFSLSSKKTFSLCVCLLCVFLPVLHQSPLLPLR